MSTPAAPGSAARRSHLVLYDGVCGLCNHFVKFLLRHDNPGTFSFAPLQSGVGKSTLKQNASDKPMELSTLYVVADYLSSHARLLEKSDAIVFVARELGWPWKIAWLLGVVPKWIRDRAYDVVARNRYAIFGRLDRCLLPAPEFRRRFLDG